MCLIKTWLNFTSNFLDQITPNLNFSARMSWFISEILKPFKSLAVIIINSKRQKRGKLSHVVQIGISFLD